MKRDHDCFLQLFWLISISNSLSSSSSSSSILNQSSWCPMAKLLNLDLFLCSLSFIFFLQILFLMILIILVMNWVSFFNDSFQRSLRFRSYITQGRFNKSTSSSSSSPTLIPLYSISLITFLNSSMDYLSSKQSPSLIGPVQEGTTKKKNSWDEADFEYWAKLLQCSISNKGSKSVGFMIEMYCNPVSCIFRMISHPWQLNIQSLLDSWKAYNLALRTSMSVAVLYRSSSYLIRTLSMFIPPGSIYLYYYID